jgi:hypothetical protein
MEKNSHLKDLQAVGPLEIYRAELDEEGSFDDAVSGCDYAFLVAAPMNLGSSNPEVTSNYIPPPVHSVRFIFCGRLILLYALCRHGGRET